MPGLLLAAAVLLGVALRFWQLAAHSSLWLDELALVNNILQRDAWQLATQPLEFAQVAPLGFVLLLDGITHTLGSGELALRLPSFACSVAALPVMAVLARDALGRRLAWLPTLLVALSPALVLQSAQVKPYSLDVLLVLCFILLGVRARRADRRWPLLALAGVVAPWFSFPVIFAMGAAALLLLSPWRDPTRARPRQLASLALWGVSIALSAVVATRLTTAPVEAFMKGYWSTGFPALPPHTAGDWLWPGRVLASMLRELGSFRGARLLALVVILGMAALLRRDRRAGLALSLPLALAFLAAALRLYPLDGRVALWAIPLTAILLVAGARAALDLLVPRAPAAVVTVGLSTLLVFPVIGFAHTPPPFYIEHSRPVLQHLARHARPGDAVYVHYAAWQAWHYYAPRLPLPPVQVAMGSCSRADRALPVRELLALVRNGNDRIWVFFSHAHPNLRERELVDRFMTLVGARLAERADRPEPFRNGSATASVLRYDTRAAAGSTADLERALAAAPGAPPGCWLPFMPDSLDRTPPGFRRGAPPAAGAIPG